MTRGWVGRLHKLLAVVAIAIAGPVMPAAAQSTPEQCASIADDGERLACYDSLFRSTGAIPQDAVVVVESERMIPAQPTGRAPATMTVACADGAPDVSFSFAGQLVSNTGDIAPVTFQVDAGGTAVRTLTANEDNTELRFATPRDAEAFLDSLIGGRNVKVRMTPVRQRSVTVDFRLPEVADQIAALRAGCSG